MAEHGPVTNGELRKRYWKGQSRAFPSTDAEIAEWVDNTRPTLSEDWYIFKYRLGEFAGAFREEFHPIRDWLDKRRQK